VSGRGALSAERGLRKLDILAEGISLVSNNEGLQGDVIDL
jgi:hypothetical protein